MKPFSHNRVGINDVDTRSLRERIADALMDSILSGELRPGAALVENEIATQLGVSRAPVREALQMLANTNLIEAVPYRGTTVRKLTRKDIEETYSLRSALEIFALQRAMKNDGTALASELQGICDVMHEHATNGDWARVSVEDDRFHEVIIARAQHELLGAVWRSLRMRVLQVMALRNRQNDDSISIFYNHLPIVEAIAEGDVAKAVKRLGDHIATAADLGVDIIQNQLDSEGGDQPSIQGVDA